MKTKWFRLCLYLGGVSLFLTGCATAVIPKDVMSTVTQPVVTFKEVLRNPDTYVGRTVLWGGEVIEVINNKEGSTVEVLQSSTDSDGKPGSIEESQGRFLAEVKEYLDAEVYKRGRLITVVGKVQGKREQALGQGKVDYNYPVIIVDHLYLWPKLETYNSAPRYYYGPPWWWWEDYWDWGPRWVPGWGFGFHYFGPFDDDRGR